jgi:pimeloyl-[acyl-carrier protein] methyl ester esterase
VLLHGWGMHGGVWDAVKPLLAARFRLHVADLPGHGASSLVTPYALENLAQEIAAAVPPRAHWCGWSLGGLVALAAARRFPQRIGKLALVAATPSFVQRDGWLCAMAPPTLRAFADALEGDYEGTLKRFLSLQARGDEAARACCGRCASTCARAARTRRAARRPGDTALHRCAALDVGGDAPRPDRPRRARPTRASPAARLADALPNARLAVFPDAAHAPFLSHPREFAEILETFLNEPK